jgi:hypothetical protein
VTIAVSLIAYTAKIVVRILRRHTKKKTEDTLEIRLDFEEKKELGMQIRC